MYKKITLSSLALSALLAMNGCGSSGDTQSGGDTQSSKVIIAGTAVDDLILNGKVKVSKPDNALLVEGRTSATNGTYTLNVENYTGASVVNVTCDADSKILVGTTEEACPAGLDLNSVANINGTAVTINISPLTDIVYQRAVILGGGEITEDSVTEASNQISIMFGVDPIVNDPTVGTYADIIEAFHVVAEADANLDLFDVIDAFVEDLSDGVVDNSAVLISALEAANVTNPLTVSDTPYVVPTNPASGDDVAEVKTMIQSLRTQATTVSDYADSEAEMMGTALDSVALDVQTVTDFVVGISDLVMQARDEGKSDTMGWIWVNFDGYSFNLPVTITKVSDTEWSYVVSNIMGMIMPTYEGTIIIPEISDGMQNTFTSLNASFNGTLPYVNIYRQAIETQTVSLAIALTKTTEGANVTISNASIENSGDKISIDSLTGSVGYVDETFNYVKLDAITLSAVAGDYMATGTLSVPEYAVNTSLSSRGGVQEIDTTGIYLNMYCNNDEAIINPNATLIIGGTVYTYNLYQAPYSMGDYVYSSLDISGNFTQEQIVSATQTSGTCDNGSELNVNIQTHNDTDELIGNSGFIPKKIAFEGSLKNTVTLGELSGTVNVELLNAVTLDLTTDISEGNEPALKVEVSGKLLMPNRPETLLNLAYETKIDDDAHRHSITGSYSYDTTLITVAGSVDKTGNNANLTFTNGSGIVATFILLNDAFVNGSVATATGSLVTKDGRVVATIEERADNIIIIKYLDGSFESIF